jgi:hypothetical protein
MVVVCVPFTVFEFLVVEELLLFPFLSYVFHYWGVIAADLDGIGVFRSSGGCFGVGGDFGGYVLVMVARVILVVLVVLMVWILVRRLCCAFGAQMTCGCGGGFGLTVEWWGGRRLEAVWVVSWLWGFGPGVLERARFVDTPC